MLMTRVRTSTSLSREAWLSSERFNTERSSSSRSPKKLETVREDLFVSVAVKASVRRWICYISSSSAAAESAAATSGAGVAWAAAEVSATAARRPREIMSGLAGAGGRLEVAPRAREPVRLPGGVGGATGFAASSRGDAFGGVSA